MWREFFCDLKMCTFKNFENTWILYWKNSIGRNIKLPPIILVLVNKKSRLKLLLEWVMKSILLREKKSCQLHKWIEKSDNISLSQLLWTQQALTTLMLIFFENVSTKIKEVSHSHPIKPKFRFEPLINFICPRLMMFTSNQFN